MNLEMVYFKQELYKNKTAEMYIYANKYQTG